MSPSTSFSPTALASALPSASPTALHGVLVDPAQFFAGRPATPVTRLPATSTTSGASAKTAVKQPLRSPRPALVVPGRVPRRPLLLLAGLATFIAALLIGGEVASAEQAPTAQSQAVFTVIVRTGDTVWSIARQHQPDGDIRPLVREIIQRNGSAAIRAGDALYLPVSNGETVG
jgi:Tfp pilus assembly protein FimV